MMTTVSPCRETLRNISAYLDGELQASACEVIEQHSLGCPGCAALIGGLRQTIGLCRQGASAEVPAAVRERAHSAMRELLDQMRSESDS